MSKMTFRPDPERDPVGPFLHYLMAECGVSPHTLAAYRSDLMHFLRWRKSHAPGPLGQLRIGTLCGYVDELSRRELAPSSICRHLASLSTFFRFLIFEGRLTDNVAKLLVAPAVWDRLPTVLGPVAVDRLLGAPSAETRLGRRDRAALETLYATGCRASEVVGLRPADLDLAGRPGPVRRQGEQGTMGSARLACRGGFVVIPGVGSSALDCTPSRYGHGARVENRTAPVSGRSLENCQAARDRGGLTGRREPSYVAAQLCHALAGRWGRSSRGAGNARTRLDRHDAGLHSCRAEPAARGACPVPSALGT